MSLNSHFLFWLEPSVQDLLDQESIMKTCSAARTFESVDEILWCDHSNETSSAVLYKIIFEFIFCNFDVWYS